MRKFLVILAILLTGNFCFADENTVLSGSVDFDWINMTEIERENASTQYQKLIFGEEVITGMSKEEFQNKYKNYLKDANHRYTYQVVMEGITETSDAKLCGFYYKEKILYMYAIQYKNNPRTVYYYDGFGKLQYIDEISENYPNFPYHTKQYRANGQLAGAFYIVSHDLQYTYKDDGTFKGVWYKDKMFNLKGKKILTRTNW